MDFELNCPDSEIEPKKLEDIFFFVHRSLSLEVAEHCIKALETVGALREFDDLLPNVVIIASDECEDERAVAPSWVFRSIKCGCPLPQSMFRPRRDLYFSGVIVSSSGLNDKQRLHLAARMRVWGGGYNATLDHSASHLIIKSKDEQFTSDKVRFAIEEGIQIVELGWIDACERAKGLVDEEPYSMLDSVGQTREEMAQ